MTEGAELIYWKNFQGQPVFYKSLGAIESYVVQTYAKHVWSDSYPSPPDSRRISTRPIGFSIRCTR